MHKEMLLNLLMTGGVSQKEKLSALYANFQIVDLQEEPRESLDVGSLTQQGLVDTLILVGNLYDLVDGNTTGPCKTLVIANQTRKSYMQYVLWAQSISNRINWGNLDTLDLLEALENSRFSPIVMDFVLKTKKVTEKDIDGIRRK